MYNKFFDNSSTYTDRNNSITIPNKYDNQGNNIFTLKQKIKSLYDKLIFYNEKFYQEHLKLLDRLYLFNNLVTKYFKDLKEFHKYQNNTNFYNLQYSIDKSIRTKDKISDKVIGKLPTYEYYNFIRIICIKEIKEESIQINNIIYDLFPNKINIDNYLNNGFIWLKFNQITYDLPYFGFLITLNLINYINDIKRKIPILNE